MRLIPKEPYSDYPLPKAEVRSIGPKNFTLNVCMRENVDNPMNWCSRYKLRDGKCRKRHAPIPFPTLFSIPPFPPFDRGTAH